jgi:hypothetical protein
MELDVFASIALYLAVFLAAGALAYFGEKKKIITPIILALLLPALLAGLRFTTGTDSITYRAFYNEIGAESFEASMSRINDGSMEPFIVFLARIGNALHLDASFIFIIFGIITTLFFYLTARTISRKSAWLYYGMLLVIVFPESFNIMRQLAAVAVQAYALSHIYERRRNSLKPSLLLVILLSAFSLSLHYSSILILPVLFLPLAIRYIRGRSLYFVLAVLAIACVCAFPAMLSFVTEIGLLSPKHYATFMETPGSIINVKFFAASILTIVYAINYHRSKLRRDKFLSFLMLIGTVYSAIGFYSGYVGRMANFFWVFIVIAAVDLLGQLSEKKYSRVILSILLGVLYFVGYYAVLGLGEIIPYSFIV